jgi:hypothetical protein
MKIRDDGTQSSQIGANTTSSTPFVVPDPNGGASWVYFQGTDNALWKVRDDGSQPYHIGENMPAGKQYTSSSPFVVPDPQGGAWVYYQRPLDRALMKIRDDGSQLSQIGTNTTASTPFVVPDPNGGPAWVYFQGTDNTLWKVRADGTLQSQIGSNTTASTPFVTPDGSIYFRGTDAGFLNLGTPGTLWKTRNATVDPDPVTTWIRDYAKILSLMGGKGVALGTDADGLSPMTQQDVIPTQYPFTLSFGCPPAPATCQAQQLDQYTFGNRTFNFQTDGVANYGLLPDFIQAASQTRLGFLGGSTAPTDQIAALMHSAEDTIEMWEKVETAAQNITIP